MSSKTVKRWITINGNHVPVYEDGTLGGVAEKFTAYDGTEHEWHAEKATGKTVSDLKDDLKKNYGLELESADADDMERSKSFNGEKVTMYDKDGNEYEGMYNKYSDGDREIVDIKQKEATDDKIKGNWNIEKNSNEHDNEVLRIRDELDAGNSTTTSNKDIADMYKNSPKEAFDVKDNGDGTYDISKISADEAKVKKYLEDNPWANEMANKMVLDEGKDYDEVHKQLLNAANIAEQNSRKSSPLGDMSDDQLIETAKNTLASGNAEATFELSQEAQRRGWKSLNGPEEPKTSFGQEFQGKADQYREKFLTNKSDEEIANIKANLDKSTAIVGTTEGDHVAYKAIEDEMSRRSTRYDDGPGTTKADQEYMGVLKRAREEGYRLKNDDEIEAGVRATERAAKKYENMSMKELKALDLESMSYSELKALESNVSERSFKGERGAKALENRIADERVKKYDPNSKFVKIGDKEVTVSPSKESAKITKGVENARRQLDFDRPGEYAEISDRHWGKTLGVSNERMAEMMSVQDPKYDYEYKKDTETQKTFGSNVTVEHHRMYRVPKESTRETTTKSPMAQAHSMSESELRAYVRSHGLTQQYNMMINNRANASHSNMMSVLRDLVADEIAVEEARKRKKK